MRYDIYIYIYMYVVRQLRVNQTVWIAHTLPHKQLNMNKLLHTRGLSLAFERVTYVSKNIILFDISNLKRAIDSE